MRPLSEILQGVNHGSIIGDPEINIKSINFDSRLVGSGDLFIAIRGSSSDGHDYIKDAVKAGAAAIICETLPSKYDKSVVWITTPSSSKALGLASSNFYSSPSEKLKLVGVTGTNGKTTVATLLYDLFKLLGYPCGLLSTVANYIDGREIAATHTTPDPLQLNRLLAEMVDCGCEYAFMEVSSHAIDQHRIAGLKFRGGLFTNLTHDHLDYHKTFLNYINAKKAFFDLLPAESFAIVNGDDRNGDVMIQNCKADIRSYSLKRMADYMGKIVEQSFDGMHLRVGGKDVICRLIGEFNAYNLLAVYAAAETLGEEPLEILTAISALIPVQGRLEVIRSAGGITGVVDYAHSPDALDNVLKTINAIREPGVQLITVVGAGGDRDRTKRPEMARISAEGSDKVILTSDNPRSEEPDKILDEMISGIDTVNSRKVLRISDRREAIRTAVMMAGERDIILVAGKGHETYQEIKGLKSHFDDREELRKAFEIE